MKLLRYLCPIILLSAAVFGEPGKDAPLKLELDEPQTAVLDPANWDTVCPNETYFDALRSMLVRFPGLADKVTETLAEGYTVKKVQLVLEWADQETARPERGRRGWGSEQQYENDPGQWNAVVYPLLRPWSTDDPKLGPTFNAWINGLAYWDRGGARGDASDRLAPPIDSLPLNEKNPVARPDLTKLLKDGRLGDTLGQRLRRIEECGFQVVRPEILDLKYRKAPYAYDWAVGIGYVRVWVKTPKLVVTLEKAKGPVAADLPPKSTDLTALAARLRKEGPIGTPSIGVPPDLAQRRAKHLKRPAGIPDWEWQRLQELWDLGIDLNDHGAAFNDSVFTDGSTFNWQILLCGNEEAYLRAMRHIMLLPPRTWIGHSSTDLARLPAAYPDLLPPGVLDHLALYWKAWLHPEIEKRDEIPRGGPLGGGGPTYFRGYSNGGGTQNFDHNAIMGTLLGSQFLKAEHPLREARDGLEYLARYWGGLGSGASQELGDTYYLGISMGGSGAIAKYAEDRVDKLLGRFHCDRLVEPLVSMYHPGLRRMTHPIARAPYYQQFLFQEGPYHVVHSLSPQGVLMHLDDIREGDHGYYGFGHRSAWGSIYGLPILGDEGRPQRFAVLGPWADNCMIDAVAWAVDRKPLPWRIHARDFAPDSRPGWHVNYLAENYALASRDNAGIYYGHYGVFSAAAQWRREDQCVRSVHDLSTLQLSAGINDTYHTYMGPFSLVQKDGKLLAIKELLHQDRFVKLEKGAGGVRSVHATVMIVSVGDVSEREVWINGRKADEVSGAHGERERNWKSYWGSSRLSSGPSVDAKSGDLIAIKDGVTYIGLVPIAADALERRREVSISYEFPVMLVHSYVYDRNQALDPDRLFKPAEVPLPGFVIEMGDAAEYRDFGAFREHLKQAKLALAWDDKAKALNASYTSGDDRLEMTTTGKSVPTRRSVNGHWPYLAEGVMRESPWSIQGSTGRIEKGGAAIVSEPGHQTYLLSAPEADQYIGYNPLTDPIYWSMSVPGGIRIEADGKLSITRVVVKPKASKLCIDWAAKPDQLTPELASCLLVFGMKDAPTVEVNGKAVETSGTEVDGYKATLIPLRQNAVDLQELTQRVRKVRKALRIPSR